ncbi:MAG: folate family ECF transporter S component [Clostridiales Family XIII bacterium]|jgi:ECF transporter S component (folate family)|nr:folate family ECF transporter S component [Clostridiales Family XIII bacterium]
MSDFFSPKGVFTPKHLAAMAMLLGIRTILNLPFLTIYLGPSFKLITFAYITDALCAMLFGPIAGLVFGFAGDAIGFLASSGAGGAYFPGFALSEMITCLIFACFFYRHTITVPRVICAWLINLAAVLLGLNMVWLILMYGMDAGSVFTAARFVNNLVQAPVHIVILWLLLPRLGKLAERHRIL